MSLTSPLSLLTTTAAVLVAGSASAALLPPTQVVDGPVDGTVVVAGPTAVLELRDGGLIRDEAPANIDFFSVGGIDAQDHATVQITGGAIEVAGEPAAGVNLRNSDLLMTGGRIESIARSTSSAGERTDGSHQSTVTITGGTLDISVENPDAFGIRGGGIDASASGSSRIDLRLSGGTSNGGIIARAFDSATVDVQLSGGTYGAAFLSANSASGAVHLAMSDGVLNPFPFSNRAALQLSQSGLGDRGGTVSATITGGTIGSGSSSIDAYDDASLTITGGTLNGGLQIDGSATAEILGGSFTSAFGNPALTVRSNATVTLHTFNNLALDGTPIRVDPVELAVVRPLTATGGILTGTLIDGSVFAFNLVVEDDATLNVVVIPEPATATLVLAGLTALVRRRRS